MTEIVAIAGSLRRKSYNHALIEQCAKLAPAGCNITIGSIHGIPLYDADYEAFEGIPDTVKKLKDQIAKADALMIATPEYNQSIPGVLKNALDWTSRPPKDLGRVFSGKPVAILGATPGGLGTVSAQHAWLPVLRALGLQLWAGQKLHLSQAHKKISEEGELSEADDVEQVQQYVTAFAEFVQSQVSNQ